MPVFSSTAPAFWAKGIPVIPLYSKEKRPAIFGWQRYAAEMPTADEQSAWLNTFPDGNIGLPLGPCSNLVAFDVDTDDQNIIAAFDAVLPKSPWVRVGKKGHVKLYRFNGERTTRFRNATGTFCEVLSVGSQVVLPPSIHPDTQRPYEANCDLLEVVGEIPALPANWADLIRNALKSLGIEVGSGSGAGRALKTLDFVAAGARDNTMVAHAGLLARAVERGERTLVQVLGEMKQWVENYVEQVAGDPLDVGKAQSKVVEFLLKDVTGERQVGLPKGWDEGLTTEDKEKLGIALTQEHEKWTCDRIQDEFTADLEACPRRASSEFNRAVELALQRLSKVDDETGGLATGRVVRFIAQSSSGQYTVGELNKQLRNLRLGDFAGDDQTEIAEKLLEYLGDYGEVCCESGRLWQWKGAHWEKLEDDEVLKVIAEQFGRYPACRRAPEHRGVLAIARTLALKPLRASAVRGINFANGFLTEQLDLVEHDPDHGMPYVLPYRYLTPPLGDDGDADLVALMPRFAQFLADAWSGDPDYREKMRALQEAIGATLFSAATRYQRAFCLYGRAATGKSQLIEMLLRLLPRGATSSVSPHDWNDKFLPAEMVGKVMNYAGELSESRPIAGDTFKTIVAGERVTVQRKNGQPFDFHPTAAQWFASNFLPRSKDTSGGFNRRWLMFGFSRQVPVEARIPGLADLIIGEEREAIAAWAVEGYKRLKANGGYTLPASHQQLVEQMANGNNSARRFLCDPVSVRLVEGETTLSALYGAYRNYCITATVRGMGLNDFKARLEELAGEFGFTVHDGIGAGHLEPMVSGVVLANR